MVNQLLHDLHSTSKHPCQACGEGNRTLCGTVCLDTTQESIEKRVAQKLCNDCRTGSLTIAGFPQFDGVIRALKEGSQPSEARNYSVCCQQGDRLVVLQAFASKFMESDVTKDEAKALIEEHNKKFNDGGSFWLEEQRPLGLHFILTCTHTI